MYRKCLIFVAAAVFVVSFTLAGGVCQATDTGPAKITLKTARAKKPAMFPHKAHQDRFKCAECHHTKGPDGKQVPYTEGMQIQKCETCHNKSNPKKALNSFMKAAHKRCKGCHKASKKGPTKCKGCHIKKKRKAIEGC